MLVWFMTTAQSNVIPFAETAVPNGFYDTDDYLILVTEPFWITPTPSLPYLNQVQVWTRRKADGQSYMCRISLRYSDDIEGYNDCAARYALEAEEWFATHPI